MICIKNGTIHNAVQEESFVADILIENGKMILAPKFFPMINEEYQIKIKN